MDPLSSSHAIVQIHDDSNKFINGLRVIVPIQYVNEDEDKQCFVRYFELPLQNEDQSTDIRDIILPVPGRWFLYKCTLENCCETYEQALQVLRSTLASLSTCRQNSDLQARTEKIKILLDVPEIASKGGNNQSLKFQEIQQADQFFEADNASVSSENGLNDVTMNIAFNMATKTDLLALKSYVSKKMDDKFSELKKLILSQSGPRVSVVEVPTSAPTRLITKSLTPIKMSTLQNHTIIRGKRSFMTLMEFSETHNLTFPITTTEDFKAFDESIVNGLYNDLKTHISSTINLGVDLLKNCTILFKTLFVRAVLRQFTAQKKNPEKEIFKDTKFYGCLKDAYEHFYISKDMPITEQAVLKAVGGVINNCTDWEGNRAKRAKMALLQTSIQNSMSKLSE